jgi:CHAD domain-containing protein
MFRLEQEETIGKSVRRIARQQAKDASSVLRDGTDPHLAVHKARTSVKKLRALLRLLEPRFPQLRREEAPKLRRIAAQLAKLREAEVLVATFNRALAAIPPGVRRSLAPTAKDLEKRRAAANARLYDRARVIAARDFGLLARRSQDWLRGARPRGFSAIEAGLRKSYRRARRGLGAAYAAAADDTAFHDWRKSVKEHGYQLRLLEAVDPKGMAQRLREVERLGELLGEDHDLAVLSEVLAARGRSVDKVALAKVFGAIEARRARLRTLARKRGEALFAAPPRRFAAGLRRDWKRWHD